MPKASIQPETVVRYYLSLLCIQARFTRTPNVRFQLPHDDIGWYLEDNIGDEEY